MKTQTQIQMETEAIFYKTSLPPPPPPGRHAAGRQTPLLAGRQPTWQTHPSRQTPPAGRHPALSRPPPPQEMATTVRILLEYILILFYCHQNNG